jgi:hypothetical protein
MCEARAPALVLGYLSKEALELMREQALDLANPETTRREHLPRTPQDDQGDREETRWRPFLQYPECREARRRISINVQPDVMYQKQCISGDRSRQSEHDNSGGHPRAWRAIGTPSKQARDIVS